MSAIKIDFEWSRAYAKAAGEPAYKIVAGRIHQAGRGKQRYAPLAAHSSLYLDFAQLNSPDDIVGFAERWGLLQTQANLANLPSEDLSFWRAEIRKMLIMVRTLPTVIRKVGSRGTEARVGKLDVRLVPGAGPTAAPVIVMEPADLLQAMNLQLAQWVAGGGTFRDCQHCGRYFGTGRGGKRTIAKFCSDEHKHAFHNANRGRQP